MIYVAQTSGKDRSAFVAWSLGVVKQTESSKNDRNLCI